MTETNVPEGPKAITQVIAGAHQQLLNAAPQLHSTLDAILFQVTDKIFFFDFAGD